MAEVRQHNVTALQTYAKNDVTKISCFELIAKEYIPYGTSYMMIIVRFTLSTLSAVTISEIINVEMCMALTFRMNRD